MLSQTRAHIMTIINITVFHTRFLSPTDQKCAESATYWQFFYYRPPGKFRFTHLGKIVKMLNCYAKNSTHTHIYIYNMIIDMDFLYQFNLGLIAPLFTGSFHEMFEIFFFFFKSSQVCDWLAKWIIMLRFMDLRWPRVFRRSNAVLLFLLQSNSYAQLRNESRHDANFVVVGSISGCRYDNTWCHQWRIVGV